MAVLIEWQTVVIRRDAIERKVPGGWAQFQQAIPGPTSCRDDDLVRVGFMSSVDVDLFLGHLQALGLELSRDGVAQDLVVVDHLRGISMPVPWLTVGMFKLDGVGADLCVAALRGSTDKKLVCPSGWCLERSAYAPGHLTGSSASGKDLSFLRNEGVVDVYWHVELGREVFVGRQYPASGDPQHKPVSGGTQAPGELDRTARDRMFKEAFEFVEASKAAEIVPPHKLGWLGRRRAGSAVKLFDRVLELDPKDWSAHFWKGKCQQSLGRLSDSLDSLGQAWLLNPTQPDIAREAGISATELGRSDTAIYYAREALRLQPDGDGLHANLALAYLFAGQVAAAVATAEEAKRAEPDNECTHAMFVLVREVAAGRMRRPCRANEIDEEALRRAMSET